MVNADLLGDTGGVEKVVRSFKADRHTGKIRNGGDECGVYSAGEGNHPFAVSQTDSRFDGIPEGQCRRVGLYRADYRFVDDDLTRAAPARDDAHPVTCAAALPRKKELSAAFPEPAIPFAQSIGNIGPCHDPAVSFDPASQRKIIRHGYSAIRTGISLSYMGCSRIQKKSVEYTFPGNYSAVRGRSFASSRSTCTTAVPI